MLACINSFGLKGLEAFDVHVEVDVSCGLPKTVLVGLPDKAVNESKERIFSSIKNSGFKIEHGKTIINLSPGDIRKEGALYDLPMALGLLVAYGIALPNNLERYYAVGELSLDGSIKRVDGILPMSMTLANKKDAIFIVPKGNEYEAALVDGVKICPVGTLKEAVLALSSAAEFFTPESKDYKDSCYNDTSKCFSDVKGQLGAKRALEIAAAGNHNILMIGSPGSGKTMLASRIPSILPPMTFEEALEVTKIYSIKGLLTKDSSIIRQRPFRAPHSSSSYAGLIGGTSGAKPGEITCAHRGVLFLDELPEFKKNVLEMLRQPLEDGKILISRAQISLTYPAQFMLAAAMNPCPCGFYGDSKRNCECSSSAIKRYISKISGPILDRIDIHIEVPRLSAEQYRLKSSLSETSSEIRKRVTECREIQKKRLDGKNICNAQLCGKDFTRICKCTDSAEKLLYKSMEELGFTARANTKVIKLARTIADLSHSNDIKEEHIAEALQYRILDRNRYM